MKILNYGSLNLDRVYDAEHFVRAGETISCTGYSEFPGGKGLNQSVALAKAGAPVYHLGAVGPDGAMLTSVLEQAGVDTRYVEVLPCASGHAVIQRAGGENCIIVCGGANQQISCDRISRALEDFGPGDLILLQNETAHVDHAIREAKARGMKVAFNASPVSSQLLQYPLEMVDYFLINEVEGQALSGCSSSDPRDLLPALLKKFPRAAIVLTLGAEGSCYADGKQEFRQKSYPVPVVDTTAAGDTFCGYFLAALSQGLTVPQALQQGSLSSALAVSKSGAAPSIPTRDQVTAFRESR